MDGSNGALTPRDRLELTGAASPHDIEIRVNGRSLVEIVCDEEARQGRERRNPLGWIRTDGVPSARARLLGTADDWPDDGQMLLLDCGVCGEEGCDPVTATISVAADTVDWSDVRDDHGVLPDIRFTFDRRAYEAEIGRALPGPRFGTFSPPARVAGSAPDPILPRPVDLGSRQRIRAILPVGAVLVAWGLLMLLAYLVSSR